MNENWVRHIKAAPGRNGTQKAQDRDVWKRPISSSGQTTVYEELQEVSS